MFPLHLNDLGDRWQRLAKFPEVSRIAVGVEIDLIDNGIKAWKILRIGQRIGHVLFMGHGQRIIRTNQDVLALKGVVGVMKAKQDEAELFFWDFLGDTLFLFFPDEFVGLCDDSGFGDNNSVGLLWHFFVCVS